MDNVTTKERYERPQLVIVGDFSKITAGFGRFSADQLVGRLIP